MTATLEKKTTAFDPDAVIRSGPALQRWRREAKISRPLYAALSDCSERTLATIEKKSRLSMGKERKINEAHRLIAALAEIMEPTSIGDWLRSPNEWFDGRTPVEVLAEGKADKLWDMIFHTREGGFV